jgi:hypothetical protein
MINCVDGCGTPGCQHEDEALDRVWHHLEISDRWRCADCTRALREAASLVGTDSITVDKLPADSRGALPKETASTIYPVSVRG